MQYFFEAVEWENMQYTLIHSITLFLAMYSEFAGESLKRDIT